MDFTLMRTLELARTDYERNLDDSFIQEAYKVMTQKETLLGIDFAFLSWCHLIHGLPNSQRGIMNIHNPIEMNFDQFKQQYLFSKKRIELFKLLLNYQNNFVKEDLTVLIGGSFTDRGKNRAK